ncbi:hypothetical protein N7530_010582 [Penicillium desertorum]|uniref:Uncharacterized protein n=1 Tax=Penicillium desertorum TaxID=1303715 RepID=A0A9W9WI70_9EURO|nr:hypothetical protein N7530_010582 [Penicillium desertorum]
MKFLTTSLASMAITLPASASRFYQCGERGEITFSGINNICGNLGSNWCSTDCDVLGYRCDTCQYTAAGEPPAADITKLQSWCTPHTWETGKAGSGSTTHHAHLEWYTYENFKGHCSLSCPGGCSYVNTASF